MGLAFTPTELDELDYLNRLLVSAYENEQKFLKDNSASGQHWFRQFQSEALRLQKAKDDLIQKASRR